MMQSPSHRSHVHDVAYITVPRHSMHCKQLYNALPWGLRPGGCCMTISPCTGGGNVAVQLFPFVYELCGGVCSCVSSNNNSR
jgi:hypothetical protein